MFTIERSFNMSLEMWIIKVHNTYVLLEEKDRTTYDGIISFR